MRSLTNELAYWINERHRIKLAKDAQDTPPWSTDPIFNTVRFCNVHREDDRVTRWVRRYWNRPLHPAWRFVVARMINWPDSLDEISGCELPGQMKDMLKQRAARGQKVFTSAYTISTCGRRMDKLDYVFDHVVDSVVRRGQLDYTDLRTAAEQLQAVDGVGSFLAGQVVADMKNTPSHPLSTAPDWWTWSTPGPGSLRGLSWYFHQQPTGVTAATYAQALRTCRQQVDPLIWPQVPRISNQDFQNCLCEFSKWCKVRYLRGHVRNKYDPLHHSP